MSTPGRWRALLLADEAVRQAWTGSAPAARALAEVWGLPDAGPEALRARLEQQGALAAAVLPALEERVRARLSGQDGDPLRALIAPGGLEPSLRLDLERLAPELSAELVRARVPTDAPLEVLPEERYLRFRRIGRGGQGAVYSAYDGRLNRVVAFKLLAPPGEAGAGAPPGDPLSAALSDDLPEGVTLGELESRFLHEARLAAALDHPGVVAVHDVGRVPGGAPYYTMRLVPSGRTLEQAFAAVVAGPLERRLTLLEPFLRVCDTLHFAHGRGIVHRDVKPENVLLGEHGEVLLVDWGLARSGAAPAGTPGAPPVPPRGLETEPRALGTLGYISPEALLGDLEHVDARSDVYALGAMLYRIVTGRVPHLDAGVGSPQSRVLADDPVPPWQVAPDAPRALGVIALGALERDRERRTPDAATLAAAVRAWQAASAAERAAEAAASEAAGLLEGLPRVPLAAQGPLLDRVAALAERARAAPAPPPALHGVEEALAAAREALAVARARRLARRARRGALGLGLAALAAAGLLAWRARAVAEARVEAQRQEARGRESALRAASFVRSAAEELSRSDGEPPAQVGRLLLDAARLAGRDPLLDLLLGEAHRRRALPLGPAAATCQALAAAGRLLAVGDEQGVVTLLDPSGGGERGRLALGAGRVTALALAPQGDLLLAAIEGRGLIAARPADGAAAEPIVLPGAAGAGGRCLRLGMLPGAGARAALAELEDGRLVLVDLVERAVRWQAFTGATPGTLRTAVTPDGSLVACVAREATGRVLLFEAADGRERPTALLLAGATGRDVAFVGPDRLVVACSDGVLRTLDAATGSVTAQRRLHPDPRRALSHATFHAGAGRVATAGLDARVWLVDPAPDGGLRTLEGLGSTVKGLAFSGSGARLVGRDDAGSVCVWDVQTGTVVARAEGLAGTWEDVALPSASGDALLLRRAGGPLRRLPLVRAPLSSTPGLTLPSALDAARGQVALAHDGQVDWLRLDDGARAPGGRLLPPGGGDGYPCLAPDGAALALVRGAEVALAPVDADGALGPARSLKGHAAEVQLFQFRPDGRQLATGDAAGLLWLWDVAGSAASVRIDAGPGTLGGFVYGGGGATLITAGASGRIATFDATTGALRGALPAPGPGTIEILEPAPDDQRLLVGFQDGRALLWDARRGQTLHELTGPGPRLFSALHDPGSDAVVLGDASGRVRAFDARRGVELALWRSEGFVSSLSLALEGRLLVAGSVGGRVLLIDLQRRALLARLPLLSDVEFAFVDPACRRLIASGSAAGTGLYDVEPERRPLEELEVALGLRAP